MLTSNAKKWSLLTLAATFVMIFTPGSSNAQSDPQKIEDLPVVDKATGNEDETENMSVRVHEISRVSEDLVILTWSATNDGSVVEIFNMFANEEYEYRKKATPMSGVTLLNNEENLRYQPIMDSSTYCLCMDTTDGIHSRTLDSEGEFISYSSYFVEKDVETVTVEVKGFPEIKEIPIE